MQRVVRSTLVGLSLIGLAACGDKVNLLPPDTTSHVVDQVTSVTVVPGNITLAVGGTASLVATVTATPGITDRTVTWSSSNTAVATVTAAGVVTAAGAGTAAIVATSKADTKVTGAAAVTVTPTQPVTVTIGQINQTTAGGSTPAVLTNVAGQIDVTLNVESGSTPLRSVSGILKSGTDSMVVTQSISNTAPVALDGDAASAPITMSFNTAALNAAGTGPALKNGTATLRAIATTTAGTQSASTNTSLTLNNPDISIVAVTVPFRGTDNQGKVWFGNGAVSIAATPILYSGRTVASVNIGLAAGPGLTAATTNTCTAVVTLPAPLAATATGAVWSVSFPQTAAGVLGIACSNLVPTVSVVDNQGAVVTLTQPFTVGTTAADRFTPTQGTFALDEQKPLPGTFPIANNALQQTGPNGYVSGSFRFVADSAAGFVGPNNLTVTNPQTVVFVDRTATCSPVGIVCNLDNGGVDKVTVKFQWRVSGAGASTYADLTSTSALSETATATTNQFRMITADALGNADTTTFAGALSNFGVDKTPPTVTVTGPADKSISQALGGNGTFNLVVSDALSGSTATNLVAQTRQSASFLSSTTTPAENTTNAGAGPCVIGRFNATAAASGAGALTVFDASGNARGFCTPVLFNTNAVPANNSTGPVVGYYATTLIGIDEAGNRAAASTVTVVDDTDNPVVASVDMPPTITGNATASFPASATDAIDLVGSWATITFNTPTNGAGPVALSYAPVAGPGVAFDNVLTRSATITATAPNFIINMQVANTPAPVVAPVRGAANGDATNVTVNAIDESNRTGGVTVPFAPGVTLTGGASSTWSTATFTGGVSIFASPAIISNGPAAGATAPSITGITVTAQGTSGTFANPFSSVQVWYQPNGAGPWFLAGTAGAGLSRDNGTNRFWDYTLNWDPPAAAPNGTPLTTNAMLINIRGIGINTNGDAVSTSGLNTITINNP